MQTEIAVLSGISVRSVQTIARNFRRYGQATTACRKKPGRLNLLSDEVLGDLTEWLINRPDSVPTYLNEMKQYLLEKFGVEASLTTIHRSLTSAGVVQTKSVWRKRTTEASIERDGAVVISEQDITQPAGLQLINLQPQSNHLHRYPTPTPPKQTYSGRPQNQAHEHDTLQYIRIIRPHFHKAHAFVQLHRSSHPRHQCIEIHMSITSIPVSYTHLTLPTIYSV